MAWLKHVAQTFSIPALRKRREERGTLDFADATKIKAWATQPPSFGFGEGRESEMPAPSGFDHVSTTKSNSTRSIAAHPCKKRKDGAPSVGMVHTKIVKGGPPAHFELRGAVPGEFQRQGFLLAFIQAHALSFSFMCLEEIRVVNVRRLSI